MSPWLVCARAVVFLWMIAANGATAMPAAGPPQLTLRASGALPTSLQKLLVELGATRTLKVPAGRPPDEAIRGYCGGSATNDYLAEVDKLNPGMRGSVESVDRDFTMPPCLRSSVNRLVISVPEGDAAAGLTRQAFGVEPGVVVSLCEGKPPATFSSCKLPAIEALRQFNGGSADWMAQLKPGHRVGVPRLTAFTTIRLKEGVSTLDALKKVEEVAAQVKEATGVTPLAGLQGSGQFRLLSLLKADDPSIKGTPCEPKAGDPLPDWPYSEAQLLRTLEISRNEARRRGHEIRPAVVRIADTGAIGLKKYFPLRSLSINPMVPEDQSVGGRGRYGIDADQRGDVRAFSGDPQGLHGTQVADLALGGYEFRSKYESVYEMVRVTFFKIFQRSESGSFVVHDSTLLQSMDTISDYENPAVVNFSVGGPDDMHTSQFQKQVLRAHDSLAPLAVVAAGNDRSDLSIEPTTYPAAYGGNSDAANWMMVVGSSAPGLVAAAYSNYSSQLVDILAPGCRLPFTAPDGSRDTLTGTSVAAPQVSFVAALLRALGLRSMNSVKARIIASSDFRPELEGRSRFASVLNAPRAVAIYHDVVRLKGESQDRIGRWDFDPMWQVCTDRKLPATNLLSMTPYQTASGPMVRVLYTTIGRLADPLDCKPSEVKLKFVESNGHPLELSWSDIDVLVPAQKGLLPPPG